MKLLGPCLALVICGTLQAATQVIPGPNVRGIVSSSSLNENLISYWKLDETSGNRVDATGTGNTLTDNATVTSNPGIISNAGQFTAASSEYLSHADNASLSTGTSYTICAWVYLDAKSGTTRPIVSKFLTTGNQREYYLEYSNTADRFRWFYSLDGTSTTSITADNFGSPSTATFYFIVIWYDDPTNTCGIQVNDGTANTISNATTNFEGTGAFEIGAISGLSLFWNGRVDEVGFWKRVLTSSEKTALYNAGAGSTCCPF